MSLTEDGKSEAVTRPLDFGGYARDDLRGQFSAMFDGLGRLSALAQLNDMRNEAAKTISKTCGHCVLWMCLGSCPREPGLGSGARGPNMNSPACDKFEMQKWVKELYETRMTAVRERAAKLGVQL